MKRGNAKKFGRHGEVLREVRSKLAPNVVLVTRFRYNNDGSEQPWCDQELILCERTHETRLVLPNGSTITPELLRIAAGEWVGAWRAAGGRD